MARIFLSHSKGDEDIVKFFLQAGGLAGVEIKAMEFESVPSPPWKYIRDQIALSRALFVLLGPNVVDKGIHTQNWISFEIGIACETARSLITDIWVFEPFNSHIKFPIPFLNHYVLYDLNQRNHLDYIRKIMEGYKTVLPIMRKISQGVADITCPYDTCGVTFRLHSEVKQFECPACRKTIEFKS
jgi:hypothetical protein